MAYKTRAQRKKGRKPLPTNDEARERALGLVGKGAKAAKARYAAQRKHR